MTPHIGVGRSAGRGTVTVDDAAVRIEASAAQGSRPIPVEGS
ncbi:hypothetical protein AB0L65_32085 [Nonomuraea sp. NPDC052116]